MSVVFAYPNGIQVDASIKITEPYTIKVEKVENTCHICYLSFGDMAELTRHVEDKHVKSPAEEHSKANATNIKSKETTSVNVEDNDQDTIPTSSTGHIYIKIEPSDTDLGEMDLANNVSLDSAEAKISKKSYTKTSKQNTKICTDLPKPIKIPKKNLNSVTKRMKAYQSKDIDDIMKDEIFKKYKMFKPKKVKEGNVTQSSKNAEKSHKCDICSKCFKSKYHLRDHEKIHCVVKQYGCYICNKRFTYSSNLNSHLRGHSGEKPYECKVCNKKFAQSCNLISHNRTHTGERPHACIVCDKKFAQKVHLEIHTRIHTGEKPFECGVCKKKFATKTHLKCHTRVHTGDKPHVCNVCNKKFGDRSHLSRHVTIHTGEKPYECNICNRKFALKDSLSRHIKGHNTVTP